MLVALRLEKLQPVLTLHLECLFRLLTGSAHSYSLPLYPLPS